MKVMTLISGGMDSVTALYQSAREHQLVGGVSFHYGSKHNDKELPFAKFHCDKLGIPHTVIRLDFMADLFASDLLTSGGDIPDGHYEEQTMKQTVVPYRNGIMLAVATGLAESHGVEGLVIAAHAGDHAIYPDCRELFMQATADAMRLGTYAGIQLLRPFITTDKAGIAGLGQRLGVDYSMTWSCYKGGDVHCGTCGTCVERREAFLLAGVPDPTSYLNMTPLPPAPTSR